MNIAVIGPGAMGLLFATKLSNCANVVLIGNNKEHIDQINEQGITVKCGDDAKHYNIPAFMNGAYSEKADLVIMFTKAYLTESSLEDNRNIIGEDTVLVTLQNGVGHERILKKYTSSDKILIGTTAQGSYRENAYTIVNSGLGDTCIGAISDAFKDIDDYISLFADSGFPCIKSDNISRMIWNKIMINASSSVLSGVLQVNQGYVAQNKYAWETCKKLICEICHTAALQGYNFDKEEQIERIYNHLLNAPGGYTSIYTDLKNGRKTEVDVISGAVVAAAHEKGISVPVQETMVNMVHAMEGKEA